MDFQKLIIVTGTPGLFLLKSHNEKGFYLESFDTKAVKFVPNAPGKVVALGNIDIATHDGPVSLESVLKKINTFEGNIPDPKASSDELARFFKQIEPNYNEGMVYPSVITKILKWHLLLKQNNISLN